MFRKGHIIFNNETSDIYEWAASDEVYGAFIRNRFYLRIVSLIDPRHRVILSLDRYEVYDVQERDGLEAVDRYFDDRATKYIRSWKHREAIDPAVECPVVVIL